MRSRAWPSNMYCVFAAATNISNVSCQTELYGGGAHFMSLCSVRTRRPLEPWLSSPRPSRRWEVSPSPNLWVSYPAELESLSAFRWFLWIFPWMCGTPLSLKANFKESYMATFYDYFNEQKYADAVKNVSSLFMPKMPCIFFSDK